MSTKAVVPRHAFSARGVSRGRNALMSLMIMGAAACGESSSSVGPPMPGSISLSTETSGFQQDDSYDLLVDGESRGTIGANDQQTITDLDPATYEVALGDVASNCLVESTAVEVTSEQIVDVSLSVTCTFGDADPYSLTFTRHRLNLDNGEITDCIFGICPSGQNEWDFYVHYNSQTTPKGVVRQNQSTGVEIAHLPGVTLDQLTPEQVAGATFTTSLVADPFDANRVILIKTNEGGVHALGNPVENDMAQTIAFDAVLLQP